MMMSPDSLPPEAVDRCLRTFFRRELPASWPRLALPERARRRRILRRSRFALAASLLVIVAGAGAAMLIRPAAPPAEPLPGNVLPPTAEKPGKHHRPLPPVLPSVPLETR